METIAAISEIVSVMTEDEARQAESEIIRTGDRLRTLLVEFYERQGYRALGYSSYTAWAEVIAPRIFGMTRRHLARELTAAVIERELGPVGPNSGPISESHLRPLSAFVERPRGPGADAKPIEVNGEGIRAAWDEANYRSEGKPTARVVEQVVDEMRGNLFPYTCETCGDRFGQPVWHCPGCDHHYHKEWDKECGNCHEYTSDGRYIGIDDALDPPPDPIEIPLPMAVHYSSATPEWYTPRHVIEQVLNVFGEIDLDPCSNAKGDLANVPAGDHFTIADDGLTQRWHGRVYMNPPYGDEIGQWTARLVQAYKDEEIDEAIALLPARTDTAWFRPLMRHLCCFVHGRLKFSGAENSAPFPSVVVYLGPDRVNFEEHFEKIGTVMQSTH